MKNKELDELQSALIKAYLRELESEFANPSLYNSISQFLASNRKTGFIQSIREKLNGLGKEDPDDRQT